MTTRREQELWAIAEEILTERQLQILRYWLDRRSTRTIARTLGLSESTVRTHLERALQKMKPYLRKDAA